MSQLQEVAEQLGEVFEEYFSALHRLREDVEAGLERGDDVDRLVFDAVEPRLMDPAATVVGAGFIGGPGSAAGEPIHFAWWLGPLEENPLLGTTTEVTRLDLAAREYADYLRDFTTMEWYSVPEATGVRHITGPYVDHLCTCDYMLTLTSPVGSPALGVVGLDILVRRIEPGILRLLRRFPGTAALLSPTGRIIASTSENWELGARIPGGEGVPVPGTSLLVAAVPT
ncbi:cache domain-containing protein [Paeniglutamicibacter sp. R2-26]|uniref:cache domain-containing protein n=1 Tax=Paeniglutamicibacter sp. R2-26 TaxID=3144417 RepID=UPI003EE6669A